MQRDEQVLRTHYFSGFYGGWFTPELGGPFKGEPGSTGW